MLRSRLSPRSVAPAAALLALLAGCGGGAANGVDAVRSASDKTVAAGSSRVAINVTFSSAGASGTVTGEGLADLENGRGGLSLDLGSAGGSLGTAGTVEAVLDRTGIFVKLPPNVLPGNKPWLKLDLSTLAGQAGINLGSLGQLSSADPTQALQFLKGAVGDFKKVGSDKLRGAGTTHYRGTLNLNRAATAVSPDARAAIDQAIASLGTATFPADVWIDGDGRMRKMQFAVDTDGAGPAAGGTVEFEMYDFGVKADVPLPPADQVTDLTALFKGLPK